MLIFNLGSLLVGAISFLLILGVHKLSGGTLSMPVVSLIDTHIILLVSLVLERFNLRPRLFFIPTWILSLVLLAVAGFIHYGYWGIAYPIVLIPVIFMIVSQLNRSLERVEFLESKGDLDSYHADGPNRSEDEKIITLINSFCHLVLTLPEIKRHNITVLELFLENHPEYFDDDEEKTITEYITILQNKLKGKRESWFLIRHDEVSDILTGLVE